MHGNLEHVAEPWTHTNQCMKLDPSWVPLRYMPRSVGRVSFQDDLESLGNEPEPRVRDTHVLSKFRIILGPLLLLLVLSIQSGDGCHRTWPSQHHFLGLRFYINML